MAGASIAFQRGQDDGERVRPLCARLRADALPVEQEAQEIARRDRIDLRAEAADRVTMDARQQPAIAPLLIVGARDETSAQDRAFGFERDQRARRRPRLEPERRRQRALRDRPQAFEPAAQNFDQGLLFRP